MKKKILAARSTQPAMKTLRFLERGRTKGILIGVASHWWRNTSLGGQQKVTKELGAEETKATTWVPLDSE